MVRVKTNEKDRGWWHATPNAEVLTSGPYPTREACIEDGRDYYCDGELFYIYELGETWTLPSFPTPDWSCWDDLTEEVGIDLEEHEVDRLYEDFVQGLIDKGIIKFSSWQVDTPGELIEPEAL